MREWSIALFIDPTSNLVMPLCRKLMPALVFSATLLPLPSAVAAESFVGTVAYVYRMQPVVPPQPMNAERPLLPGSTVIGVKTRSISGVQVLDFEFAKSCAAIGRAFGKPLGTTGFRSKPFSAQGNSEELRLAFGVTGSVAKSIMSYTVTVVHARYYVLPGNDLDKLSSSTGPPVDCPQNGGAMPVTVVKPVFADIEVTFVSDAENHAALGDMLTRFFRTPLRPIAVTPSSATFLIFNQIIAMNLK